MAQGIQQAAQKQMVGAAVQVVKDNPEVQKEIANQAGAAAQDAANQAGVAWSDSFRKYLREEVLATFMTGPCCSSLLSFEICKGVEDWRDFFGRWNVIWLQTALIMVPVSMVTILVVCIFSGAFGILLRELLSRLIVGLLAVVVSHLSYWLIYQRGGCCGGAGFAIFGIMYVVLAFYLAIPPFHNNIDGISMLIVSAVTLIMLPPSIYVIVALWKLGGGESLKYCCGQSVAMAKGAYNASNNTQATTAPGAAPAAAAAGGGYAAPAPATQEMQSIRNSGAAKPLAK